MAAKPKNVVNVKPKKERRARNITILVIVSFILWGFFSLINFFTDWMWFDELGYVSVFLKKLTTQLKFGIPMFVVLSGLMYLYLTGLRRGYFKKIISHEETNQKRLGIITLLVSVLFSGWVTKYVVGGLWFEFLKFLKSTSFGKKDPLFGLDISFYVFKYEFLNGLNAMLLGIVVLFVIATVFYYAVLIIMHSPDALEEDEAEPIEDGRYSGAQTGEDAGAGAGYSSRPFVNPFGENTQAGKIFANIFDPNKRNARMQSVRNKTDRRVSKSNMEQLLHIASGKLSILGIIFYVMLAFHFLLKQFDLLHKHTGVVYGAGYTDVNVTLWIYRVLIVLCVLGAVTIAFFIAKKMMKQIVLIPIIMLAVILIGSGAEILVQNVIVAPDEINKESEYLARNIEFTQYAYATDKVDVRDFAASNDLDASAIANNDETVGNIRINDYEPVEKFYNQTQSIRQYYKFNDTDVDRYYLNGEYAQTYLSVREIDEKKINDTWLNRHIKYTHGYGLAVSRVDKITASGQPDVVVKDIPPKSSAKEITIKRPEIYFGELSSDYIVINTNEDEFDYPDGQSNKYTRYKGSAGIKLTPLKRLMFAVREGSFKLLVSSNINSESRIIINRNIEERVKKIMPYLSYEDDPYGVAVDGKIYWMIDAYTTSSLYPYSEPYSKDEGNTNYIRNSIKVVVDAYNGDVKYYITDKNDPIAMTYKKMFPKLFKDIDEMPASLKSHVRYPHSLFKIQADVYGRYHMNDVKVFYQNEDLWEVSHEIYGTRERKTEPNYLVTRIPGEEKAEFVSMLPYSPKSKQNMTGILMTRNDGKNYGKLMLYRFPKNRTIYGPMQIEAQIDQNTKISQDFSLWSQAGSTYSRGSLFVVPINNSLLYIEPIYLEASNSAIPEVKRVIVAYEDKIAYEPTLEAALESLFGEGEISSNDPEPKSESEKQSVKDYIQKANGAYQEAQEALKSGDWKTYGEKMTELEKALKDLQDSSDNNASDSKKSK